MKDRSISIIELINEAACYGAGDGVRKNIKKSRSLYEKAAEHGSVRARYEIGMSYLFDNPKDLAVGIGYLRQAAKKGEPEAQKFLADCYANGRYGVRRNKRFAALWNEKAEEKRRGQL